MCVCCNVGSGVYFRYFETARALWLSDVAKAGGEGAEDFFSTRGVGPILSHTAAKFIAPLQFPDTIAAGIRIADNLEELDGRNLFVTHYRVASTTRGRVCAEGEATIVIFDYTKGKKAAIPESVLRGIKCVEDRIHRVGGYRLDTWDK